jgi:hypothetical protein
VLSPIPRYLARSILYFETTGSFKGTRGSSTVTKPTCKVGECWEVDPTRG